MNTITPFFLRTLAFVRPLSTSKTTIQYYTPECKECVHFLHDTYYDPNEYYPNNNIQLHRCKKSTPKSGGIVYTTTFRMRMDEKKCGPKAVYFEKKSRIKG